MATNGGGKTELAVRRSPLRELEEMLPSALDRWPFDLRWPLARRFLGVTRPEIATVDMFEKDGNVVVKAEMPGIQPDHVEVTVSGNELRISGERREEKEIKEEDYYCSERTFGRIYRTLALPEGCDTEKVSATMKDGVLEVTIPKKQAAAGKKIQVQTA